MRLYIICHFDADLKMIVYNVASDKLRHKVIDEDLKSTSDDAHKVELESVSCTYQ